MTVELANGDPPRPLRFVLDTLDGERVALRFVNLNTYAGDLHRHDGATGADLDAVKRFPEVRWSKPAGAWIWPPTPPNVQHLLEAWDPREYALTDGARLLLAVHLATVSVQADSTAERHAYLTKGVVPDLTGYLAANPPPRAHQIVAFASARYAEFFALTMEMGTGKSRVVVDVACDRARALLAEWEAGGRVGPAPQFRMLVVAPKTVCGNWQDEFAKWATLDVHLVHLRGSRFRRLERLVELGHDKITPVQVAVINYEGLAAVEAIAGDLWTQLGWDLVVFDESVWIKNPGAKRTKAAYRVAEWAKSRFILTGLPITKNVEDLYGQFHAIKPGCLGFANFAAFKAAFCERNFLGGTAGYNKHRLPELQARLASISFSVKRAQCVDLPPKQYVTRDIELGDAQRAAYEQMSDKLLVDLAALPGAGPRDADASEADIEAALGGEKFAPSNNLGGFSMASVVLVQLLRLAQITSGFLKLDDGTLHRFDPNPKLDAVKEYLSEIDDADKVIVWSRFREDIERVTAALEPHGAVAYYGGVSDKNREANLERFHKDPTCRVFVGQPQSAGFGINLVEATHVLYYSNEFGLQPRMQSEDRSHRMGQTRSVLYVDLVVPNTIDTLILERIREKRELADLLTDRGEIIKALSAQLSARKQATE